VNLVTCVPQLRLEDLEAETAELLPRRETMYLFGGIKIAPVIGVNVAIAVNAATINSNANAFAAQFLTASQ
jgi:hypothetical protein